MFDPTKSDFGLELSLHLGEPHYELSEDGRMPFVRWPVTLMQGNRRLIETKYGKGCGHFQKTIEKVRTSPFICLNGKRLPLTSEEEGMFWTWEKNPQSVFKHKDIWGSLCVKLAQADKSTHPTLEEVLGCLLMEGAADFNAMSFEDWACEYGYDPDSRKAERVYNECVQLGRVLRSAIPTSDLNKAIEWSQNR